MKNIKLILFFIIFQLTISYVFSDSIQIPKAEYFQVSDSVVMAKHAYGSNITCISTNRGLYFIDCGLDSRILKKFRIDMEKKFKNKTKALIITHAHIDHFFGMSAFKDIPVYASEKGKKIWDKYLSFNYKDNKVINYFASVFPNFIESAKFGLPFTPTNWFKDKEIIGEDIDKIIFTHVSGHTMDSSSVYFPKEEVLVSGDLVQVDQYPYFGDPTTDMKAWLGTFKYWETLSIKKVCPGHGSPTDPAYIRKMSLYFNSLINELKVLKRQSIPMDKIVHHDRLPKGYWGEKIKEPRWWAYCIKSLYQKL